MDPDAIRPKSVHQAQRLKDIQTLGPDLEKVDRGEILGLLDVPATTKDVAAAVRRAAGIKSSLGEKAVMRLVRRPDLAASMIGHHRARLAMHDLAVTTILPAFFDELGRRDPNPTKLRYYYAILEGVGLIDKSVPVEPERRGEKMKQDADLAGMTREEIRKHVLEQVKAAIEESPGEP